MKTLIRLSMLILVAVLGSCGSTNSSGTVYEDPHAKMHRQVHSEFYQEEAQKALEKQVKNVLGFYKGIAPCSDCEGIDIELELLPDLSYKSTVIYMGKPNPPLEKTGGYKFNERGIVQLIPPSGNLSYFIKTANGLKIVDKDGNDIRSAQGELFILKQVEKKK